MYLYGVLTARGTLNDPLVNRVIKLSAMLPRRSAGAFVAPSNEVPEQLLLVPLAVGT